MSLVPDKSATPSPVLNEMMLRAAALVPPTVFELAEDVINTPSRAVGQGVGTGHIRADEVTRERVVIRTNAGDADAVLPVVRDDRGGDRVASRGRRQSRRRCRCCPRTRRLFHTLR